MVFKHGFWESKRCLICNPKKEFDTINREILLKKLTCYGSQDQTVDLFQIYLSQWTQITIVNNVRSKSCQMTFGVPQGSILQRSAIVFIIYINDLLNWDLIRTGESIVAADDTDLTRLNHDPEYLCSAMKHYFLELSHWFEANKLGYIAQTCINIWAAKCFHRWSKNQ